MNAATFDTHQAVRRLEAAGIETRHAEAIVSEMRDVGAGALDRDQLATKADLEPLATKAELAGLEARMYRALWIQGGAIVAILTGLKLLA